MADQAPPPPAPSRQQHHRSTISVARLHRESLATGHLQQHQHPSQRYSVAPSTTARNPVMGSGPGNGPGLLGATRPGSHSLSISGASSARPSGISLLNNVRSAHLRASIANHAPHAHRTSLAPNAPSKLRHTMAPTPTTHLHRSMAPVKTSAPLQSPLPLRHVLADRSRQPALPADFMDAFLAFHSRTEAFAINLQHGLGIAKENLMHAIQTAISKDTAAQEVVTQLKSKLESLRAQRAAALSLRAHHSDVRTQLQSDLASLHAATQSLRTDRTSLSLHVAQLESRLASLRHALIDRKLVDLEMQRKSKAEINQYAKLLGLTISIAPHGQGIVFAFDHVLPPPRLAKLRLKQTVVGGWEMVECVPALPSSDLDRWMAEFGQSGDTRTLLRRVRTAWLDLVQMSGSTVVKAGDAMSTIR
ncbi:hypothetical protein BCR44DRAFT_65065 [Catenaria anguillulae PL171]|uniref:Kinetochore protein SPC25 n=1 Tax=Catenaria anguillulae PL171 TaxID=765915 RepID=A0A1Y2HV98_9FUNG|nr:hypothetical protein BCR44DRAFT_65065 [Catenaria anguillulae PL171]